jgi:hypothetical protein
MYQNVWDITLNVQSTLFTGSTFTDSIEDQKYFLKNYILYWRYKDLFLVIIPNTTRYCSCLHSIYIVLDSISNLEMI